MISSTSDYDYFSDGCLVKAAVKLSSGTEIEKERILMSAGSATFEKHLRELFTGRMYGFTRVSSVHPTEYLNRLRYPEVELAGSENDQTIVHHFGNNQEVMMDLGGTHNVNFISAK